MDILDMMENGFIRFGRNRKVTDDEICWKIILEKNSLHLVTTPAAELDRNTT